MTSPLWLAVGSQSLKEGLFTKFLMCPLFAVAEGWLVLDIRMMSCSFDYTAFAVSGKVERS